VQYSERWWLPSAIRGGLRQGLSGGLKGWLACWLGLMLVFSGLAYWQARASAARDFAAALQATLPGKLDQALRYGFSEADLPERVVQNINADLSTLRPAGAMPFIKQCRAQVVRLMGEAPPGFRAGTGGSAVTFRVPWLLGERQQYTDFALDCDTRWPLLFGTQSLLAAVVTFLLALLPVPVSATCLRELQALRETGMPAAEALPVARQLQKLGTVQRDLYIRLQQDFHGRLPALLDWLQQPSLAGLDATQVQWLHKAYACSGGDLTTAAAVAASPAQLEFFPEGNRVRVHGLEVPLAKTPFFYYLWYARLRRGGDGWQLNPAVNRPDRDVADELVALMEAGGGHAKAINDLRENGLRAKTLDQNRNKIKDELIAALGEDLAERYLFQAERDPKSSRYRYRLALDGAAILIH